MVPKWLTGTWKRTYIRRRRHDDKVGIQTKTTEDDDHLGDPDSTVDVTYIQTPWAFVDVRSKICTSDCSKEKPMAFAGVTTVTKEEVDGSNSGSILPLVKWHACMDLDEASIDCKDRWVEAEETDSPRPTNDVGYFLDVSKKIGIDHAYHEYDPDRTYLEQWVRMDGGDGKFLAVRNEKGTQLLVVAGKYFGFANQEDQVFIAGVVKDCLYQNSENWVIESNTSASGIDLKGTIFSLPKLKEGGSWKVLKGSTITLATIECLI